MIRFIQRVITDIAEGKNIDAYVVTAVALIVAVLSVIEDVVPLDLQMAALLAAVALLVFKSTRPEEDEVDLDPVLHNRQNYGPFREFIRGGNTIWIYGPSSTNILTNSSDVDREVLARGGEIRVLLQDPNEAHSIAILQKQIDIGIHKVLLSDIQRSILVIQTLQEKGYKISYRFLPYNPGFSMVAVNPDGRDGRLTVEFYGFINQMTDNRMHVVIERSQSKYWFDYWVDQYEKMWNAARTPEK